ncbi:MAG: NADH-quinone oxidoreductase subunit N [Rickettsiales bacterium]|nr:NADH-quinone oxidoreductase subunit N [Rickettsiales bacterium]
MNLIAVLPEISLFFGAIFILMSDVFLAKKISNFFCISHLLALVFCAFALLAIINNFNHLEISFNQMLINNSFTIFAKAITVTLLTIVILFSLNFLFFVQKISAEILALMMISAVGAMVLISANDFLTFYLALELQGLALYLLAALNKKSAKSSEAGMKYFVLGSLASGILLFGISMIYGFSGTINFSALSELYSSAQNSANEVPIAVMFGFILVIIAMFFKIAAAPFHMWSPDVYEGSPTIVTTFFATVAKFAASIVLIRLISTLTLGWIGMNKILVLVALTSIVVGSFGAIAQKNIKRLLAYSSISHIGFVILGLAAFNKEAVIASVFYMVIYAVLALGSFGFLNLIRSTDEQKAGCEDDLENDKIFNISSLSGLAKTNPFMAFSLAALMFSTAGIPPFAGFFSKFYIIMAALRSGFMIPAIIAILVSVISAYYYLRIVKIMYFDEAKESSIKLDNIANIKIIVFFCAIINLIFIVFIDQLLLIINNFVG